MKPEEIVRLRKALGISQPQLAEYLGVHPMTVSKWERGAALPTQYQIEMMEKFRKAANKNGDVKGTIAGLAALGALAVVGFLLYKAIEEIGDATRRK